MKDWRAILLVLPKLLLVNLLGVLVFNDGYTYLIKGLKVSNKFLIGVSISFFIAWIIIVYSNIWIMGKSSSEHTTKKVKQPLKF
ncbi:hypothetical protein V7101_20720 [Bacillus velezensis]|uniref:hypothetical protein n=1 Tax=Bacillus velezensis TaxID=492670 RepID=UPI002FFD6D77